MTDRRIGYEESGGKGGRGVTEAGVFVRSKGKTMEIPIGSKGGFTSE